MGFTSPTEPLFFSILISAEHGEWCLDKRSAKARIGAYYEWKTNNAKSGADARLDKKLRRRVLSVRNCAILKSVTQQMCCYLRYLK